MECGGNVGGVEVMVEVWSVEVHVMVEVWSVEIMVEVWR